MYLFSTVGIMAFSLALAIAPSTRSEIRRWLKFLFANAMLLTLVGFYFFSEKELIFGMYLAEGGIPFASFHYKNSWAAYAILSVGIGLGLADYYWRSGHQLLGARSLTLAFLVSIPIVLSSFALLESRSGLLLTILLVIWTAFDHCCRGRRFGGLQGKRLLISSVASILILGWWGWKMTEPQLENIYKKSAVQIDQVEADQPTGRMILIRDTIEMAKAKPWFGWGLATFSQVYPVFQGPELYKRVDFPGGEEFAWVPEYYEFAHCDWVQYWAETGMIGLVLLLATPIAWVIHFWHRGRSNPLSYWLGVGCVLILLLATFEFPSGCEAVSLLFAACLSLSGKYALCSPRKRSSHRHQRDDQQECCPSSNLKPDTACHLAAKATQEAQSLAIS
jgi:O-antigen ligase